jgi:hypothetical protein
MGIYDDKEVKQMLEKLVKDTEANQRKVMFEMGQLLKGKSIRYFPEMNDEVAELASKPVEVGGFNSDEMEWYDKQVKSYLHKVEMDNKEHWKKVEVENRLGKSLETLMKENPTVSPEELLNKGK